eukprot:TRINITY_DN6243_c0_g1_i1.p1 TRINITY_DN6243_c0_g1~~TRINITY_DN6243_c0_g1_i1.p1  ORF type:complete len:101 (-),score=15.84 TRINITY_DN6243_c0_g1_i1:23-325(-)
MNQNSRHALQHVNNELDIPNDCTELRSGTVKHAEASQFVFCFLGTQQDLFRGPYGALRASKKMHKGPVSAAPPPSIGPFTLFFLQKLPFHVLVGGVYALI